MYKNRRINPVVAELLWLVAAAALTGCFALLYVSNAAVDIYVYDTYFIVAEEQILLPLFLLISFLLFIVKEFKKGYSRTLPSWIIILSGISLVVILSVLIFQLPFMFGFTIYPPLSALSEEQASIDPIVHVLKYIAIAIQLFFISALLFVVYKWGKSRQR